MMMSSFNYSALNRLFDGALDLGLADRIKKARECGS
jgi:hypothetical protein